MLDKKRIARKPKSAFDNKCPYCRSENIIKGEISYDAKPGDPPKKGSKLKFEVWHCSECKETFHLF
jgi:ribosomal protein L37AE/L43A